MKRPVCSAQTISAGYPRLARAWRLLAAAAPLLAASVAHADATPPPGRTDGKTPRNGTAQRPKPRPPERPVMLNGGPMRIVYPEPPPFAESEQMAMEHVPPDPPRGEHGRFRR